MMIIVLFCNKMSDTYTQWFNNLPPEAKRAALEVQKRTGKSNEYLMSHYQDSKTGEWHEIRRDQHLITPTDPPPRTKQQEWVDKLGDAGVGFVETTLGTQKTVQDSVAGVYHDVDNKVNKVLDTTLNPMNWVILGGVAYVLGTLIIKKF